MSNNSAQNVALTQQERYVSQERRTAEAKEAFKAHLQAEGAQIDAELQERAKNIHANEKALENQQKDVQRQTRDLAKQADAMEKFVAKSRKQLSALDDLDNLNTDLDQQLAEIEELLDIVESGKPVEDQRSDNDISRPS